MSLICSLVAYNPHFLQIKCLVEISNFIGNSPSTGISLSTGISVSPEAACFANMAFFFFATHSGQSGNDFTYCINYLTFVLSQNTQVFIFSPSQVIGMFIIHGNSNYWL